MGLDLYPEIVHEGDLSPDAFGAEVDEICSEIHAACKGVSTKYPYPWLLRVLVCNRGSALELTCNLS